MADVPMDPHMADLERKLDAAMTRAEEAERTVREMQGDSADGVLARRLNEAKAEHAAAAAEAEAAIAEAWRIAKNWRRRWEFETDLRRAEVAELRQELAEARSRLAAAEAHRG